MLRNCYGSKTGQTIYLYENVDKLWLIFNYRTKFYYASITPVVLVEKLTTILNDVRMQQLSLYATKKNHKLGQFHKDYYIYLVLSNTSMAMFYLVQHIVFKRFVKKGRV